MIGLRISPKARYLRGLIIVAMLAVLTGCAGTNILGTGAAFDRSDQDGIVIIGLTAPNWAELEFHRYDATTRRVLDPATGRDNAFDSNYTTLSEQRYRLHRLKPGYYALHQIHSISRLGIFRYFDRTYFTNNGMLGSAAPVFFVDPGEVVYVGDLELNNRFGGTATSVHISIQEDAARNELKRYPNIKPDLTTRPARPAAELFRN